MSKKNDLEHTTTMLGSQNMKSSQRMVSVVEPYELPEGWKWETLEKLCFIPITDGTHQTPTYSDSDSGIPFISSKDVTKEFIDWSNIKYITKELHSELYKRVAPQIDDILLAKNGTTGVAAIVDTDKIFDIYVTLALIRPNKEIILPRFLLQVINSPICKNQFDEHLTGIGVPNLHLRDIRTTMIPLPPTLAEQQRIVNRIESMFAKLDEAKEKAQNVVDGFETRKAAILHKAFTGELTAKWRKENGVSDDSWEEKTIGELFTHTTGKALKKDNQIGTLRKYITTSNLYWGRFDFSEVREMYFTDGELEKCTAKKGDLLVCNGGDVGRSAIWDFDYDICLQNHVSKLRKKDNNIETRLFFYYFMLSKIKGNVTAKGIGISSLSQKDLLAMKINLPTLPEQQEIVRILDSVLEKERIAKQAAESALEQIDLLKKSILARAFRGEL